MICLEPLARHASSNALATALFTAAVLTSDFAQAGPFSTIGFDADAAALSNANVAWGRSTGALYTNPALLADLPVQLSGGALATGSSLHVRLPKKPNGSQVPISIYDSNIGIIDGLQDRALPSVELPNRRGDTNVSGVRSWLTVGGSSWFVSERLRVGATVAAPMSSDDAASVAVRYNDEREGSFSNRIGLTRFGQWDRILAMLIGASYTPYPWLSIGAGAGFSASAVARVKVYIPDASVQNYASTNLETSVSTVWRPLLGVRVIPKDWLSVGVAWRDESAIKVDGASEVTLWNYHESGLDKTTLKRTTQAFPVVVDFEPMEVSGGIGIKTAPLTAHVSATWQRWSHYVDEHGAKPQDLAAFPPSPFNTQKINSSRFAFQDTITLRTGVELPLTKKVELLFGGVYSPSPVPAQVGRTNFADSDLLSISFGQRTTAVIYGHRFYIITGMQLWSFVERTTYKDPKSVVDEFPDAARTIRENRIIPEAAGIQSNNPGYPGYTVSGAMVTAGLTVTHIF